MPRWNRVKPPPLALEETVVAVRYGSKERLAVRPFARRSPPFGFAGVKRLGEFIHGVKDSTMHTTRTRLTWTESDRPNRRGERV